MDITAPGLASVVRHLRERILPRYPEIKTLQIYRTQDTGALVLWLSVPWPVPIRLWDSLARIAREADLIAPVVGVQINELAVQSIEDIRLVDHHPWAGDISEKAVRNLAARHDLMSDLALLVRTILEVSKGGIYTGVNIRHGGRFPGKPELSVEEMIGQPVHAIAGWDAHHKILEVVNQAIDEDRVIHFAYTAQFRGEDFGRDFQAVCKPKPDKSGAWLAVARIQ
ncbi:MAG: hypothetical protein AAFX78_03330 [Cyanobacteria bacterium J06638_20]